jgi:hypothetical protein
MVGSPDGTSGGLLLDMEGTLVDTEPLWFAADRLARSGPEAPTEGSRARL